MPNIIKASDQGSPGDCTSFQFDELSGEVVGLRPNDSSRAAALLAQAQRDADEIRRVTADQGHADGQAASEQVLNELVEQRLATLVSALDEVVLQIDSARTEWLAHWEQTVIHLAVAMAERVIRCQLDHMPQVTPGLVREALELAAGSGDVQLRLHPDDYETMGHHSEQMAAELARLGKVDIVADPSISKGGCRVDTQFGAIDQQFEAQLARIEQELT
jgi:flagellar assembly protein FliH